MSKESVCMTIRTDREVKVHAAKIFSALGMDMSTAVNVFLRQAIRAQGLPFEVKVSDTAEENL